MKRRPKKRPVDKALDEIEWQEYQCPVCSGVIRVKPPWEGWRPRSCGSQLCRKQQVPACALPREGQRAPSWARSFLLNPATVYELPTADPDGTPEVPE